MFAAVCIALIWCTAAGQGAAPVWQVGSTPVVSIGTAAGAAEYEFSFIGGAVRLSDGRIVVSNGGTNQLRFYNAEGRFIRAVGREGEGPGEFRRIGRLWRRAGDTLIVYDNRKHRLSVFDGSGRFVNSGSVASAVPGKFVSPIALFADGSFLSESVTAPAMGVYDRAVRDSVTFLRVRLDGGVVHTYGTFAGTENFIRAQGSGATVMPRILGRETHAAATGFRVYIGTQDSWEIRVFDGTTPRAPLRQPVQPRPVTRAVATQVRRQWVMEGGSEGARQFRQQVVDAMPLPNSMPAYGRLVTDTEGMLWVEDYRLPAETPAQWRVFDASGQLAATVSMPADLDVREIGRDYVLGVARDSMDVERVRMYRLERR